MKSYVKILITLAFILVVSGGSVFSQRVDVRNQIETNMPTDINTIKVPTKKKHKKRKKHTISESDLQKAAEMRTNARYRKKRSAASKKCKKAAKKPCGKNKKISSLLNK